MTLLSSMITTPAAYSSEDEEQPWATSIFFELPLELQYKIRDYVLGGDIRQTLFKPTLLQIVQHHVPNQARPMLSAIFDPNNQHIVTTSNWCVNIRDIKTGQLIHVLQTTCSRLGGAQAIAFNYKGDRIACASNDCTLRVYDAITKQEIPSSDNYEKVLNALAFNPDGTEIICVDDDGNLHIHNTLTNRKSHTFKGHDNHIRSVAFNSNGSLIATASDDHTVRIFDALTHQERDVLPHKDFALSVAFHPHEDLIASGCADKYVYLWDRLTKKIIHKCKHNDWVFSVAFSPDGSLIASGSYDKTVHIWDTTTGKQLHILNGHTKSVNSVTFNQDGSLLASASRDDTVRIWHIHTLLQYKKYVRDTNLEQALWISHEYQTAMQGDAQQHSNDISAEQKKAQIIRKLAVEQSIEPAIVNGLNNLRIAKQKEKSLNAPQALIHG